MQNEQRWFRLNGDEFAFQHSCPEKLQAVLELLTEELVDWRLAAYSKRRGFVGGDLGESTFEAKVSHSGGRPILFLPEKSEYPGRPMGPTKVRLPDRSPWEFKFVKVACNVAWPVGETKNQLGDLICAWFGPDAGLPGTDFKVRFTSLNGEWYAIPLGARTIARTPSSPQEVESTQVIESNVERAAQYKTHLPVYDLAVAAGGWGPEGVPEVVGWMRVPDQRLSPGMFAARVLGRSMEPRIHDGQWCVFQPCPIGSRQNRLLLLQVNTHLDPEDGGRYTVKRYHSTKRFDEDGWHHQSIELQPLNSEYPTIHIPAEVAEDIRVIGEFVSVIRDSSELTPT